MIGINYGRDTFFFPRYYGPDAGWHISAEIRTKHFFSSIIKEDFNIIDAGAQIGMYTVPFSKWASKGTVYAFEPTDTVEMLKENLNHNECRNVSIQNVALSNKDGIFSDKIYKVWSQGIVEDREFQFQTVDTFIKKNNLKIDLIKIDVDSYDFEVLQGCESFFKEQNPYVVVELNSALEKRNYRPEDALKFMDSIGYELVEVFDNENFFFSKRSA